MLGNRYKLLIKKSTDRVSLLISASFATSGFHVYPWVKTKKVLIVGGGSAGIGVSAILRNEGVKHITLIEPNENHFYQAVWPLIGVGQKKPDEESVRPMKSILPKGVTLKKEAVAAFVPQRSKVILSDSSEVHYDFLVIAAGMQLDWNAIPGLAQGIEQKDSGVVSIYDFNLAQNAWQTFRRFKSGDMLFTMPNTPVRMVGTTEKILFLAEDMVRDKGLRDTTRVELFTPATSMFGVKKYSDLLEKERLERDIDVSFHSELVAVDAVRRVATFRSLTDDSHSERPFDVMHVTPPMSAPDFLKRANDTGLVDAAGFVAVDPHTLRSSTYPNVFALGDCCNTPNSKTPAAVIPQSVVLVHNLMCLMEHRTPNAYYSGYSSCPLLIAPRKCILAEFGYDGVLMETFDRETGKWPLKYIGQGGKNKAELRFFYWLVYSFFPFAYWHFWVRGRWFGPNGLLRPKIAPPPSN